MRRAARAALAWLVLLTPVGAQQSGRDIGRDVGCSDWRQCREMALAAADGRDYERFHDLAWRAVQLGPLRDPMLLTVLARAQALSGRPDDALVMLDRLAEMGVASDADTSDDFVRTRQLPGWSDVAARIERVRHPDAATPAATIPAPEPVTVARSAPSEAVRFSTGAFTPGGLAYDAVSGRFLFGDRLGRKLFIVSERSNRTTDFVRGDAAGFNEIAAVEIDAKRGDLWVASAAPNEGAGTVHKLQLISGRMLRSFQVPDDFKPVALVDLAVTPAGVVLVLDSAGGQVLVLRPGATALERLVRLDVREPVSLTVGQDEGTAYAAHRDGISRIDLRTRTESPLTALGGFSLAALERIRWHDRALVAVRRDDDGSRQIVRLDLNATGRTVVKETTLERAAPIASPTFLAFSGDDLVYLADGPGRGGGNGSLDAGRPSEFITYRVRVR